MKFEDALNSCCFVNEYRVAVAQQNGSLAVIDTRNSGYVLFSLNHIFLY